MSLIDLSSLICSSGVLIGNLAGLALFVYAAIKAPKFTAFWIMILAYLPFVLLATLNFIISFGKDAVLSIFTKSTFAFIYPASLIVAPLGAILAVISSFLMITHILKTLHTAEQGAAVNP